MDKKTYVLDTSVIMGDPPCISKFSECNIVIPLTVLAELDKLKQSSGQTAYLAREAIRNLDEQLNGLTGLWTNKILQPNLVTVTVGHPETTLEEVIEQLGDKTNDGTIIATALEAYKKKYSNVVLLSNDVSMRILASSLGITTEQYRTNLYDDSMYKYITLDIPEDDKELLASGETIEIPNTEGLRYLQGVIVEGVSSRSCAVVVSEANRDKVKLSTVTREFTKQEGTIVPKNAEQLYLWHLLRSNKSKIVFVTGQAGTGKTLLSLDAGIEAVMGPNRKMERLVVIRPMVAVGEEMGFLPGDVEHKMEPWMKALHDNLRLIFSDDTPGLSHVEYAFQAGLIEIAPLQFIRGRTISKAFIYVDEVQNLTPSVVKVLLSRVGHDSKIVLAGDPEQIDTPYLNRYNCGLTRAIHALRNEPIVQHAHLVKTERSKVADLAARLL